MYLVIGGVYLYVVLSLALGIYYRVKSRRAISVAKDAVDALVRVRRDYDALTAVNLALADVAEHEYNRAKEEGREQVRRWALEANYNLMNADTYRVKGQALASFQQIIHEFNPKRDVIDHLKATSTKIVDDYDLPESITPEDV